MVWGLYKGFHVVKNNYNLYNWIHFHAGIYGSKLLTCDIKNTVETNIFDFEKNISYTDFNSFDFGLIGGTSLHYKSVALGIRYNLGLLNVATNKNIAGINYNIANGRNSVATIFVSLIP